MPITAAGVSAAGSLLSGLSGFFGRGNRGNQDYWNQKNYELARDQFTKGVQTRVEDARKAGISPLAALGIQGVQLPSFGTTPNSRRGGLSQGLESVGRASKMLGEMALEKERQELTKNDQEIARRNLSLREAELNLRRRQYQASLGPIQFVNPQPLRRSGSLDQAYIASRQTPDRATWSYRDEWGNIVKGLNPQLAEGLEFGLPMLGGMGATFYDWLEGIPGSTPWLIERFIDRE